MRLKLKTALLVTITLTMMFFCNYMVCERVRGVPMHFRLLGRRRCEEGMEMIEFWSPLLPGRSRHRCFVRCGSVDACFSCCGVCRIQCPRWTDPRNRQTDGRTDGWTEPTGGGHEIFNRAETRQSKEDDYRVRARIRNLPFGHYWWRQWGSRNKLSTVLATDVMSPRRSVVSLCSYSVRRSIINYLLTQHLLTHAARAASANNYSNSLDI